MSLLQLILVLLCGFCVWGVGLLALLFAARGLFLGYCAASVAAQSGASALLRYRLDTLLSDVGTLLLCLWLAGWAVRLAMELFRACAGVLRGRHRAQRGGWQSVLPRRWRCQRLSLSSGLYSPSLGSGASGADGFCSTYFWVASGEAATAFFSCSRLMWV